jgi:DnaJ family protein C protein 13
MSPCRLVVSGSSLLERDTASHEVLRRRPLANLAALVRFSEDARLLGIEWDDGAAPVQYMTPARDAVLACIMDAAQVRAAGGGGGSP